MECRSTQGEDRGEGSYRRQAHQIQAVTNQHKQAMSTLTIDQICEMIADTRGLALLLKERLEKLENVVSKEEMPKTKELDDIVAKMYKDVERLKQHTPVTWVDINGCDLPASTEQYSEELLKEAEKLRVHPYHLAFANSRGAIIRNIPIDELVGKPPATPPNPDPFLVESGKIAFTDCSGKRVVNSGYCPVTIDPTASPKNMPFSVALEFLKAGREVRRAQWKPDTLRVQPRGHEGAGGLCMVYAASLVQGDFTASLNDLLATDWMVIEERGRL